MVYRTKQTKETVTKIYQGKHENHVVIKMENTPLSQQGGALANSDKRNTAPSDNLILTDGRGSRRLAWR